MSERIGKPPPSRLNQLIKNSLGKHSEKILVGAGPGLDAAVIDLGDGQVMAVAEDPIFPAPKLPLDLMGWFTVHIGASDVAVTGVKPEFMTYTLLMPPESSENEAKTIIHSISDAAKELNISIVGGHTGWYSTVVVPIIGGVAVWGFANNNQWISPGGAKEGDIILMTKGPAIEAAALLAVLYRDKLTDKLELSVLDQLCSRTDQITVVDDALTAFAAGGVHAMHDATEGGVLGGLWEMSAASGLALHADVDANPIPEDIAQLAEALDFDPWYAISEGTLLAAVAPESVDNIQYEWDKKGIANFVLGQFTKSQADITITRDGKTMALKEPDKDPFWELFFNGL